MAGVTAWMFAAVALAPAVAVSMLAACRGTAAGRLAALQTVTCATTLLLAVMTFAFDQPALIDVALALALTSLPASLLMAVFVERWL